jgi:hypothetical protein
MFSEIPSRRITDRRQMFVFALYGAIIVALTIVEIVRRERVVWSDAVIGLAFLCIGGMTYRRLRHAEPWTPPEHNPDGMTTELKIAQDDVRNGC